MLLFIVVALILYGLYSRPHRRVPSRPIRATSAGSRVPDAGTARAAAVAGGLSTAPGGGTTASAAEPEAAHTAASEPGGATLSGSVNAEDEEPEDGTGASE
jgi:hypothetical protein